MEKPALLYFCCKTLILLTCIATAAGLNTPTHIRIQRNYLVVISFIIIM